MRKVILLSLAVILLCAGTFPQADPFRGIQCNSDVVKTLTGRQMGNGTSSSLEEKHKDIGLTDMGGEMGPSDLFTGSWKICNQEYVLLITKRGLISDVIKLPEHSSKTPYFSSTGCKGKGVKESDVIEAVLENASGKDLLPAKAAWKINEKTNKFVSLPTEGLLCPRDGVIDADKEK